MAVLDATRSIAASELVMTPLATSWIGVSPDTFSAVQSFLTDRVHPLAWDPAAVFVVRQPGFAVFAVLAFLLHAIGHKPRRRRGGRFAEI